MVTATHDGDSTALVGWDGAEPKGRLGLLRHGGKMIAHSLECEGSPGVLRALLREAARASEAEGLPLVLTVDVRDPKLRSLDRLYTRMGAEMTHVGYERKP